MKQNSRCWVALEDDHALDVRAGEVIVEHRQSGTLHYTAHRVLPIPPLAGEPSRLRLLDLGPGGP